MRAPCGQGNHISILRRLWRMYYQITVMGAQTLAAELDSYKRIVTIAQHRKLFPKTFAI